MDLIVPIRQYALIKYAKIVMGITIIFAKMTIIVRSLRLIMFLKKPHAWQWVARCAFRADFPAPAHASAV